MPPFDDAQLRRLDLTLLLVFAEAMEAGTLSAAARRLGLTQSAVSHAVRRLRDIFGDELFVRTPRGVRPTPRAEALRAPIAEAIRLLGEATSPARFDPATDARLFRVAAPDYETSLFAPLLMQAEAGATRVLWRNLIREDATTALAQGAADLMLGFPQDRAAGCDAETLYREGYRVVGRAGHPALARPLTCESYAACGHVLVAPGGTLGGVVDAALAARGLTRHVAVAVPYFLAAMTIAARTDLLATLPRRLAGAQAPLLGLDIADPPLPLREFPVQMVWPRRLSADPGMIWFRGRIKEVAVALGG